jgi:hypothetical protein
MQVGPPPFSRGAMVRQNRPEGNNEVSSDEREKHRRAAVIPRSGRQPRRHATEHGGNEEGAHHSAMEPQQPGHDQCEHAHLPEMFELEAEPDAEPAMASMEPDAADPRPLSSDDGELDSLGGRLLHRLRPVAPTEPAAPGRRRGARPCSQHRPAADSSIRSCRAIRGRSGLPGPRPQPR